MSLMLISSKNSKVAISYFFLMENLPKISVGLDNFRACLAELGMLDWQPKLIHVGGTNGKGSTVNYLTTILEQEYQVGTFQTPELISRNDIIQINHQPISKELFEATYRKYEPVITRYNLCVFEAELIIAFDYFQQFDLDFIIVEVGLGGTKDPTNALTYDLAVITNVSKDHQQFLGDTIAEIALNKAGIIKNATPIITGETNPDVIEIFKTQARQSGSTLITKKEYSYLDGILEYKDYRIEKIESNYQVKNIALALEIVDFLILSGIKLEKYDIINSIENSKLLGRFTRVRDNLIVDGAHNVAGIRELITNLRELESPLIVFNCFKDKDYRQMYQLLKDENYPVIIYYDDNERSITSEHLQGPHISTVEQLEKIVAASQMVVVCGSLKFCLKVYQKLG